MKLKTWLKSKNRLVTFIKSKTGNIISHRIIMMNDQKKTTQKKWFYADVTSTIIFPI